MNAHGTAQACGEAADAWIARRLADLAARLAGHLRACAPSGSDALAPALALLEQMAAEADRGRPAAPPEPPPVARLMTAFGLGAQDIDLLMLAGMAEHDESLASVLSLVHPAGRPRPTAGLAERLLCTGGETRVGLRARLTNGALVRLGALRLDGEGPLPLRDLTVESAVWTLLLGVDALLPPLRAQTSETPLEGLSEWLVSAEAVRARDALRGGGDVSVIVAAEHAETALHRALALVRAAGVSYRGLSLGEAGERGTAALALQSVMTGAVPVLRIDGEGAGEAAALAVHPGPLVIACRKGNVPDPGERTAVHLETPALPLAARRAMWAGLAPELAEAAPVLAVRLPVEPFRAARTVTDMRLRPGPATPEALLACFRDRAAERMPASVDLVRPVAGWAQLVLPEAQIAQLRDAVARLEAQGRVLDEWRFLADRRGARGVRLLFAGPPGTGKTLAAEVLARALDADLMAVDLSRLVSKWIGETEKNLAAVFDAAEEARAVLFFDEAEALFGRRTEVNDAHDRYANLETAYLLARLERYDGLAVLATNLRRNLDAAFVRRLDHIVEFREPGPAERAALWRTHLPEEAPLDGDVDLDALARLYPMTGGQVRNACLSAAYAAAREGRGIGQAHFVSGIRREFEKAGKPFRDVAAGAAQKEQRA